MPFIKEIRKNAVDSHQISPGYLLTFVRWSNRDTYNYDAPASDAVRQPLFVYNDAISVSVTNTKNQLTPTATFMLKGGDLNYSTAIHPGDFVLVNLVNSSEKAKQLRIDGGNLKAINGVDDGFKGLFKVQSVVRNIDVDPGTGIKSVTYIITAAGFTELNNVIYYNPAIVAEFKRTGALLYSHAIGDFFEKQVKSISEIQEIYKILFKVLVGESNKTTQQKKIPTFGKGHFLIPSTVGQLMGVRSASNVTDIYNYVLGIWKDSKSADFTNSNLGVGFNPNVKRLANETNFYTTGVSLQGNKEVKLENWNQVTAWSILKGYLNPTLNEIYTTYRVNPQNKVMPTIIVRQKIFTTEHFQTPSGFNTSRFLRQPKWVLNGDMITNISLSKNEAARYNFVQVFTRSLPSVGEQDMAEQISMQNFVQDQDDIRRNGLRPYIASANFDFPTKDRNKRLRAREWAQITSDWVIDGHLKESGGINCIGIEDPISVGDNVEFDGVVYHIEGLVHVMKVNAKGVKSFRTKLTVSYGMDKRSSRSGPVYAQMDHTDAHTQNIEDYKNERILPGISDTQDILGRTEGEESKETRQGSFTPAELRRRKGDTTKPKVLVDLEKDEKDNK